MYSDYFGFKVKPFSSIIPTNWDYLPASRRLLLDRLVHNIYKKTGVLVLLGPAGVGKTTFLKRLLTDCEEINYNLIFKDLSYCLCSIQLPTNALHDAKVILDTALVDNLPDSINQHPKTVYLLDHADRVDNEILEKLLIAISECIDAQQETLLILTGLPHLESQLEHSQFEPYKFLLNGNFTLDHLDLGEVEDYIIHRLNLAGHSGKTIFTDDAIHRIAELSEGIPQVINILCGNSLFQASLDQHDVITKETVNIAAEFCALDQKTFKEEDSKRMPSAALTGSKQTHNKTLQFPGAPRPHKSLQQLDPIMNQLEQVNDAIKLTQNNLLASTLEQKSIGPVLSRKHLTNTKHHTQGNFKTSAVNTATRNTGIEQNELKTTSSPKQRSYSAKQNDCSHKGYQIALAATITLTITAVIWTVTAPQFTVQNSDNVADSGTVEKFSIFNESMLTQLHEQVVNPIKNQPSIPKTTTSPIVNVSTSPPSPKQPNKIKASTVIKVTDAILQARTEGDLNQNTVSDKHATDVEIAQLPQAQAQENNSPYMQPHVGNLLDKQELATKTRSTARYQLAQEGISYDFQSFFATVERGDETRLKLFLDANMPVDVYDDLSQNTALITAAAQGHLKLVTTILDKKPAVNRQNKEGQTALISATSNGHFEISRSLLVNGANVHVKDKKGWDALMFAAEKNQVAIVKELLHYGADKNTKDTAGQTALSIAQNKRHVEIVALLQSTH